MPPSSSLLILLFFTPFSALSCPPGEWLQQGVGWQMCVPIPGAQGNTSPAERAEPAWADRWGAIAVDRVPTGSVGFGAATAMKRKSQAERAAINACRAKGGKKCEVMITYHNQCASLVWGDQGFSTSGAASEEEAARRGMSKCTLANDTNCEIFYSGCSLPERVQ